MDIIRTLYYIQGALGDENIFAVLYVSLCYGPYTLLWNNSFFYIYTTYKARFTACQPLQKLSDKPISLPSFISNADFRPPPLADGYRESLEAVNKMSLHTCSVSKKTGPLHLIWHHFISSQHLRIIFVDRAIIQFSVDCGESFLLTVFILIRFCSKFNIVRCTLVSIKFWCNYFRKYHLIVLSSLDRNHYRHCYDN